MSSTLTADMRAVIEAAHLCFAGPVSPDGKPNVSPKGTIRVWDDQHLFFLDIASPVTRATLQAQPWMELNVVDQLSRRSYRFFGPVTLHVADAVFEEGIRRVQSGEQSSYPVAAVILLSVERAAALVSPGYWRVPDERAMRALWREAATSWFGGGSDPVAVWDDWASAVSRVLQAAHAVSSAVTPRGLLVGNAREALIRDILGR